MRPASHAFVPRPSQLPQRDETLGDLRFRALLSEPEWAALPPEIRRRFSHRLVGGATVVYAGLVVGTRVSSAGWWLAPARRPVGAPLPIARDRNVASVVAVTEDLAGGGRGGGQVWTRLYA